MLKRYESVYGTFLTSLLVIKCHDMVADQAGTAYNVTWSRTTPVVVSCCDDAASSYITGEMNHRMGMDVNGTSGNVWAFRFACSSAFSPIEEKVANPDNTGKIGSVTLGIGERIFDGETPELFYSNGQIVFKIKDKDDLILLVDPETGIVRDVSTTVCGAYCYHNQITNNRIELAQNLTSSDLNVQPRWLNSTAEISVASSTSVLVGLNALEGAGITAGGTGTVLELSAVCPPVLVVVGGALVGYVIFEYCVDQGWLPPERCREICGNAFLPFALINTFLYDEPTSTIQQLQEAYWKTSELLWLIAENEDEESYDMMFGYPGTPSGLAVAERYEHLFAPPPVGGDNDEDLTEVGRFMREKLEKTKEKWNDGDVIGAMKEFKWVIAGSSVITLKMVYENLELIEKLIINISKSGSSGSSAG